MVYARISKYDPKYRVNGIFIGDDWTSVSEIGQCFNGEKLSKEQYRCVERKYADCILELCEISGQFEYTVKSYWFSHSARLMLNTLHYTFLLERNFRLPKWHNEQVVVGDDIALFVKDCLRESCWGKLEGRSSYIHFGYDYYVYVGLELEAERLLEVVNKHGLFCEWMHSPYNEN